MDRTMEGKDGVSVIVRNRFEERLTDMIARRYGEHNVRMCDDGTIRIHHRKNHVNLWIEHDCATAVCCLRGPSGDNILIPRDEIADYAPTLAHIPYARPAVYLTDDGENYVPHHSFIITESNLEYPDSVIEIIDNLCGLVDSSSEAWNQMISERWDMETSFESS